MMAALPEQMRQANLAMVGNLHLRVGDESAANPAGRRVWARLISVDRQVDQGGTVQPASDGRLSGLQAGTDLWASRDWKLGLYVAQLDGDVDVSGFARGISGYAAGTNDIRNQYLGAYATWADPQGAYVDGVLQGGRHRTSVEPAQLMARSVRGHSALASLEIGKAWRGVSNWFVEPQVQVAYQRLDVDDAMLPGATVRQDAANSWMLRLGVRVGGEIGTSAGVLMPYARLNYYRGSSGSDIASFIGPAGSTDIATRTGGASTELAAGATWRVTPRTSMYGEIGKLWSVSGETDVGSNLNASIGVKLQW